MSDICNQDKCLRKFRENSESEISKFCGLYFKEREKRILNSQECPYFCEKFWCYETKKEITKHEDVNYISTDFNDFNFKYYNGLFAGMSRKGADLQEKRDEWENKHENEGSTICPYCDYEFEDCYESYEEIQDEETECDGCGKTFLRTVEVSYSYSTRKLEEYEESED